MAWEPHRAFELGIDALAHLAGEDYINGNVPCKRVPKDDLTNAISYTSRREYFSGTWVVKEAVLASASWCVLGPTGMDARTDFRTFPGMVEAGLRGVTCA